MWFLPPKQNKRGIIYNNYILSLSRWWTRQQGICAVIMGWYFTQIFKSLKFSWKNTCYLFWCLHGSRQVSLWLLSRQENNLSNHATNIEQLEFLLVLWKLSKNSCERVVRYKYMHKNGKKWKIWALKVEFQSCCGFISYFVFCK